MVGRTYLLVIGLLSFTSTSKTHMRSKQTNPQFKQNFMFWLDERKGRKSSLEDHMPHTCFMMHQ